MIAARPDGPSSARRVRHSEEAQEAVMDGGGGLVVIRPARFAPVTDHQAAEYMVIVSGC
jgi:hypothetical protein